MATASKRATPPTEDDPKESARAAGLRYVTDAMPGIGRRRSGAGFAYAWPDGRRVDEPEHLARVRALAVPPAWTGVWISPTGNGHLQATGRDARGRKQYRYHARWGEVRDETKYERTIALAEALPRIRARVAEDLARPGLGREKVLATVVRLLEATLIRVGNDEYAKENRSFGLTTLRNRHVDVEGTSIRFRFPGKAGKEYKGKLQDARLARVVKRCQDLPGQELFQYVADDGQVEAIGSVDVNLYLRGMSDEAFSAKDFRTWGGSVFAAQQLRKAGPFKRAADGKRKVAHAVEIVAKELGNTPAVCRACYIHPGLIEAYLDGSLPRMWDEARRTISHRPEHLKDEEAILLAVLRDRLTVAA